MKQVLTPLERVVTTISHKEPDKVPLLFFFTFYGAKELGISIKDYFTNPDAVVEGQLRLQKKYNNDCVYTIHYGCIELEAIGVEVKWKENGPPVANSIVIKNRNDIKNLRFPPIKDSKRLQDVLKVTRDLKKAVGDHIPVLGGVISPFSLPIIQMGFDKYLQLIYYDRDGFWELMEKNIEFSLNWAHAQLEAGATTIGIADPLASLDLMDRKTYLETGYIVAKRFIPKIGTNISIGFAGARAEKAIDYFSEFSNVVGFGVSTLDNIGAIKKQYKGRYALVGNLNGIEMISWDKETAVNRVKALIKEVAPGGGFILADNHGEIPYFVNEEILLTIRETVDRYGIYPIVL